MIGGSRPGDLDSVSSAWGERDGDRAGKHAMPLRHLEAEVRGRCIVAGGRGEEGGEPK